MSIDKVLDMLESNYNKDFNSIPFADNFPRFSKFLPGIMQGKYYCITGTPGSAKTQFTDYAFVYHVYDFAKATGVEVEIVYFSFEISKDAKLINGISKRLFDSKGLRMSPTFIQSVDNPRPTQDQRQEISQVREYFKGLEKILTVYDDPMTPSQIHKIMLDKMKENGDYNTVTRTYSPRNPDKYIIFITDHVSLIQPEHGQGLHLALAQFSSNNIVMRNKFGATIVNVHQQAAEGGVEKFTSKGDKVTSKVEPKLAGLADNRTLGRDYDVVLGLFSPFKHELDLYRGYKTKRLEDRCRFLSIVKNREGQADRHVGLYFDGAVGYFEELPRADEFTLIKNGGKVDNEMLYEKYINGKVGQLDPDRQRKINFM